MRIYRSDGTDDYRPGWRPWRGRRRPVPPEQGDMADAGAASQGPQPPDLADDAQAAPVTEAPGGSGASRPHEEPEEAVTVTGSDEHGARAGVAEAPAAPPAAEAVGPEAGDEHVALQRIDEDGPADEPSEALAVETREGDEPAEEPSAALGLETCEEERADEPSEALAPETAGESRPPADPLETTVAEGGLSDAEPADEAEVQTPPETAAPAGGVPDLVRLAAAREVGLDAAENETGRNDETTPVRGYRVGRLKARRQERQRVWSLVALYTAAACVALGAVLGAYFLVRSWEGASAPDPNLGRLVLFVVTDPRNQCLPSAWLALYDAGDQSYDVFTVPRALLLEGAQGEYVMAGDVMGRPQLRADLNRLIGSTIPVEVGLTYADLRLLSGSDQISVKLGGAIDLHIGDAWRTFEGSTTLNTSDLAQYLGSRGRDGHDEDAMARAILTAVFHGGALMPAHHRSALKRSLTASFTEDAPRIAAQRALGGLMNKPVKVARIPSHGQFSEGQFAFRPDKPQIMALVTRLTPDFGSKYTVLIRNGTGQAGIGELVRARLGALDANLPSPGNAQTFSYKRTQILAGAQAIAVAEDVRAILGRGVVLSGEGLPPTDVVVIIGADLKAKDLQ